MKNLPIDALDSMWQKKIKARKQQCTEKGTRRYKPPHKQSQKTAVENTKISYDLNPVQARTVCHKGSEWHFSMTVKKKNYDLHDEAAKTTPNKETLKH